ncbi:hypothetical protein KIW84_062446 [Lathyrus oleraceus]|uniref:Uncharacterized protein n=1 Tax=Pisum sativum TaxID=3888 RepID=A0A9D4W5V5_PEA|nr:hypothetical protein KIW84_062446 [Pisum sativum]
MRFEWKLCEGLHSLHGGSWNNIPCFQGLPTKSSRVTFICRCAGVCAFGVVIAKHVGDERLVDYYLRQFKEIKLPHDFPCEDYTLYTGDLGTTYLVFKAFQVIQHLDDLNLCLKIVKACDSASAKSSRVTFICRCAGVCAFGVVIAKHVGDERLVDYYLRQFKEIKLPHDFPCENYTLYTGDLGTTYLVFKAFQVIQHLDDLNLCLKIVKACDSASAKSNRVTFICRCAGVCAFGVVIAKHVGDERLVDYYLRQFKEIKLPHDFPCEDDAQVRPKNDKQKNTQDLKKKDENKPNVFCGGYYSVNLQPKANNPFVNNVEVDFGI